MREPDGAPGEGANRSAWTLQSDSSAEQQPAIPRTPTQRAQVIPFQEITLKEGTICEKSAEHNSAHQAERHREQNAVCPWEGMLSADS